MNETGRSQPGWLNSTATWMLILFGWSLPVSLFGMQVALVAGVACLLALGVCARGRNLLRSPLDRPVLALLLAIGLSLLFAPGGASSFRTATSFCTTHLPA